FWSQTVRVTSPAAATSVEIGPDVLSVGPDPPGAHAASPSAASALRATAAAIRGRRLFIRYSVHWCMWGVRRSGSGRVGRSRGPLMGCGAGPVEDGSPVAGQVSPVDPGGDGIGMRCGRGAAERLDGEAGAEHREAKALLERPAPSIAGHERAEQHVAG